MKSLFRRNKGIGLVEILITMGVLAVGILGVAGLNSVISRQSQDNKAQAEALAIAQSRIEVARNYTNDVNSLTDFTDQFPATQGFQNATPVDGVNATFTPSQRITNSNSNKILDVVVAWTDADGDAQSVALNTELSYMSPRSKGDYANTAAPAIVDAPTGRARLGEGTLDQDAELKTDNLDGTKSYQEGEDLKLAVGNQIVLTLALACNTDSGICMDFVKIKGRVYIDTASTGRQPHEVSLIASDAAYCARYYTDNTGPHPFVKNVTSKTQTPQTAGNQYEYFDYTCYLGGGWHGNVGVVLAGGVAQKDKVCIGDPLLSSPDRDAPTIAIRRAYRGMLYKPSDLNDPSDAPHDFYSQGIHDNVTFPAQNGHGHDFVIGEMAPAKNAGTDCTNGTSLMTRTDSYVNSVKGALFQGMPGGFVCLNEYSGYLDPYDTGVYANKSTCPWDPTNPPSTRFVISGSITLTGTLNSTNDAYTLAMGIVTSDGEGNCLVTPFNYGTSYVATYECDVYDWVNDSTTGWNGYIKPTYPAGVMCTPNPLNLTNVTADDSTGNNFACSVGASATWTGNVTQLGSAPHTNKTITGVTATGTDGTTAVNVTCGFTASSYSCTTAPFFGTFTGTFVFTSGGGKITDGEAMCPVSATTSKTYAVSNKVAGNYTQDLTIGCDIGVTATWTGSVTPVGGNPANVKKLQSVTLAGVACTIIGPSDTSYTCTTSQFLGTWSGDLKITSAGGAICANMPTVSITRTYPQLNKSSGSYTQGVTIGKTDGSGCP